MLSNIPSALRVFFWSMLPVIELRGGIIRGFSLNMPWYENFIICVIANLLPIPFILLFIKKILNWMKKFDKLNKIALSIENKANKNKHKVTKYQTFGLFLFVAIPLPGTGAWTGALIASLLKMDFKRSMISIILGVLTAGIIMCCACYGFIGFLKFLV